MIPPLTPRQVARLHRFLIEHHGTVMRSEDGRKSRA